MSLDYFKIKDAVKDLCNNFVFIWQRSGGSKNSRRDLKEMNRKLSWVFQLFFFCSRVEAPAGSVWLKGYSVQRLVYEK